MAVIPGIGASATGLSVDLYDPHFPKVNLLLRGDGTNGQTSMLDQSSFNRTVSCFGHATTTTGVFRFPPGSLSVDGTGDYFTCDGQFSPPGTQDITLETWIYPTILREGGIIDMRQVASDLEPYIAMTTGGTVRFYIAQGDRFLTSVLNQNSWTHLAITRAAGVWRAFVDGIQIGGTYVNNFTSGRNYLTIGTWSDKRTTVQSGHFTGYFDDVRLTIGLARYIGSFTPPVNPAPSQS
jgi:Concanavalin A-like lectin/glucanases superfamily